MRSNRFDGKFTLIELIAVIVVIGIIMAIVVPNVSLLKKEGKETAISSDAKNLQTAIDMYQLDNHGEFPTGEVQPELGKPVNVDFDAIYPDYIRGIPKHKGIYYWVDYQGELYYSTIDNPIDFKKGTSNLTWTPNEEAKEYKIFEVQKSNSGKSNNSKLVQVDIIEGTANQSIPKGYSQEKIYLISTKDANDYLAAPVVEGYQGSVVYQEDTPVENSYNENVSKKYTRDWISSGQKLDVVTKREQQRLADITPDGRYIVWSDMTGGESHIYAKDMVENREFLVMSYPNQRDAKFSYDGRYIVSSDNTSSEHRNHIFLSDLSISDPRSSYDAILQQYKPNTLRYPHISEDGTNVVYLNTYSGTHSYIGVINSITGERITYSEPEGQKDDLTMTTNGKYIAFSNKEPDTNLKSLYRKNMITGELMNISMTNSQHKGSPDMTPDGRYIVWREFRDESRVLYHKDLLNGVEKTIVSGHSAFYPQITESGRYVFWQDHRSGKSEIYGKDMMTGKEVLIVNNTESPSDPHITPDGKLLFYNTTNPETDSDIVVQDISDIWNQ